MASSTGTVTRTDAVAEMQPYEICYSRHPEATFDSATRLCTWSDRVLNLVALDDGAARILDSRPLVDPGVLRGVGFGLDRLFFVTDPNSRAYRKVSTGTPASEPLLVRVASGLATNRIVLASTKIATDSPWGWSGWIDAEKTGTRALLGDSTLQLLETADPATIQTRSLGTVQNWPEDVLWLDRTRAVLSLGDYGVQIVNLP